MNTHITRNPLNPENLEFIENRMPRYVYHGTNSIYFDFLRHDGLTGRYPDELWIPMKKGWDYYLEIATSADKQLKSH